MSRFVQFSEFGGPEVLRVIEVEPPTAGPGQVRVRVLAAGLNPVDHKIFSGRHPTSRTVKLPSGNGNDFAGVIDEVGDGVSDFSVGDAVFGGSRFFAQADYLIASADVLLRVPAGLTVEQAGGLDIAGRTAWASERSLDLTSADTVLVSAAAGGVGLLASQLAIRHGATVIGTASSNHHEFLRSLGIIPVEYGEGLVDRIREAAPDGISAVLDNHGPATVDVALELGVPGDRINTIAAHGYEKDRGVSYIGGGSVGVPELADLAALIADGVIQAPIDSVYAIENVAESYERMIAGHLLGKIVLTTE